MNTPFIQNLLNIFNKLDWFVGGAFLAIGLYLQNWWIVAGGVIGLLSAYYQPAAKLKQKLESKLLAKGALTSDNATTLAEEDFYSKFQLEEQHTSKSEQPQDALFQIWGVAHNQLCPGCVGVFTPAQKAEGARVEMLHKAYY